MSAGPAHGTNGGQPHLPLRHLVCRSGQRPHPDLQAGRDVREGNLRGDEHAGRRFGLGRRVIEGSAGRRTLFLADGKNEKIHVMLRETMEILTTFGAGGRQPGQFFAVHSIALDSKGEHVHRRDLRGTAAAEIRSAVRVGSPSIATTTSTWRTPNPARSTPRMARGRAASASAAPGMDPSAGSFRIPPWIRQTPAPRKGSPSIAPAMSMAPRSGRAR